MTREQEYIETLQNYRSYTERTNNGATANSADEYRVDCREYERELDRISRVFSKAKIRRLIQKSREVVSG